MTRNRGTIVRTFDAAREGMDRPVYAYAYAVGTDGRTYVICSEGVGWEVTEDRPLIVDTFGGEYVMPLTEVRERAENGTDVDLADHIRTFGSRLDSNHYMWTARLSGK